MEAILELELQIISFVQNIGGWLLVPMQLFSFLGHERFYLFFGSGIFWCLNSASGMRLVIYLALSVSSNTWLKFMFHSPRPFWVYSEIAAYQIETSFGIPSGHAQNAVMVFGSLTRWIKTRWFSVSMAFLVLLIGFSRLFLGVHFIKDVLAGWLIGWILLLISFKLEQPLISFFHKQKEFKRYLILLIASLGLIFIGWLAKISAGDWLVPEEWIIQAKVSLPPEEPMNPYSYTGIISIAGTFFGSCAGYLWLAKRGGWKVSGQVWQRVIRYIVGIIGLLTIYIVLGMVFPDGDDPVVYSLRFFRYGFMGIWVTALAPLLFRKLKLSD